jgi:hypothetical protein
MASDTDETKRERYVAALRFSALNRAFDPVVRLTMREARFKRELLTHAALRPAHHILALPTSPGPAIR